MTETARGRVRVEDGPKRVRVYLGGELVADTTHPKLVWEVKKGDGYSPPTAFGERLVFFHRVGQEEVVDCLHAPTGKRYWRFSYPSHYNDRYGSLDQYKQEYRAAFQQGYEQGYRDNRR